MYWNTYETSFQISIVSRKGIWRLLEMLICYWSGDKENWIQKKYVDKEFLEEGQEFRSLEGTMHAKCMF